MHQHENLISIIAVASSLIVIALMSNIAKQYPPEYIDIFSSKPGQEKVQGYVKPGTVQQSAISNNNPDTINLLAGLTEDQVQQLNRRFDQAASLLHAKQYEYAITALEDVVHIQPNMPEAYVNMGFAYLGLQMYDAAIQAFDKTLSLRLTQLNAYYGMAIAYEAKKDYEAALGSMRSYIHLARPGDPYLPKARAAVWEWETKLGRKPNVENPTNSNDPHQANPIYK